MNAPAISIDALRSAVAEFPHDSLMPARLDALEHMDRCGLPTPLSEEWKYTDLEPIVGISNRWLAGGAPNATAIGHQEAIAAICANIEAHWLVVANGIIDEDSLASAKVSGIAVTRLSERDSVFSFDAPLADLNTALLRDGLHICISATTILDKPVGILIVDDATTGVSVSQSRIEIELEANSRAEFIEYHASFGDADHYANTVIGLNLSVGASTNFVRIQNRNLNHSQTSRLAVRLDHDSRFDYCGFDLGGRLIRNDLHIDIHGRGASAAFHGLYVAGDGQHIDNHTRSDHHVGPATSEQEYRGILSGDCRCVWNGKAIVHAGADGTDAQQANHNLLLSEKSEIDTKPELEIYADEVKCSHGTTVGQLDENALFYLRSRGLNKKYAKQILTRAFAGSIVNKSPITTLRQHLAEMVEKRLRDLTDSEFL